MSLHAMGADLPSVATNRREAAELRSEAAVRETATEKAIDALTKFIPAEVLAPYLAFASAASESTNEWNPESICLWFIVATPLLYALFELLKYINGVRERPKALPLIWRSLAAAFAFAVWALAAPNNPWQSAVGGPAFAGALATMVSPILVAVDRVVLWLLAGMPPPKP